MRIDCKILLNRKKKKKEKVTRDLRQKIEKDERFSSFRLQNK